VTARLESFLYHRVDGLRSLQVSEDGATYYTLTITATETVTEALADWEDQANAHGSLSLTYSFEWKSDGYVKLSASGTFYVELDGSLPAAFGFSSASLGPGTSFQSDDAPKAIFETAGVYYEAAQPVELTDTRVAKFGRVDAWAFHLGRKTTVRVAALEDVVSPLMHGPIFNGKLRIWTDTSGSGAYSESNLNGYLDVYPSQILSVEALGATEGVAVVTFTGTVEEA
jgi:hypothetical protein